MSRSNTRAWYRILVLTPLVGAACAELTNPSQSSLSPGALTAAFSTVPVGYGDLTSSFVGTSAASVSSAAFWLGGGRNGRMERSSLMGGGLQGAFSGEGGGFGRGLAGPFGGGLNCTSTFNAATGRVVCAAATQNGLTINRSAQYKNAAGTVQQAFDSATTNGVNIQSNVTGTVTYTPDSSSRNRGPGGGGGRGPGRACWGDGRGAGGLLLGDTATIVSATTTVNNTSDRTTTGLASGSTQRTVSGTSRGQESATGVSSRGNFTATRLAGDTTTGLVIPVVTSGSTYPTAGTVIRAMQASLTYAGAASTTVTRREVITYDGSATAKVVITENGTTRNCTRALPRGELSCS
ncbi:MAG TPA: hypothetical protein VM076_06440 [Gemmatimonadaceae bacterium]|nr:hypothetical protein [Gemmatimonadaceae bacterium]